VRPVLRPLLDPPPEELHLPRGELQAGLFRRHHVFVVVGGQSAVRFALVGLARDDGEDALAVGRRALVRVEPELCLTGGRVGAVALEAGVGEDGADVAVEVDAVGQRGVRTACVRGARQGGERQHGECECRNSH
jgi:hypothetical protein